MRHRVPDLDLNIDGISYIVSNAWTTAHNQTNSHRYLIMIALQAAKLGQYN